MMGPWFIRDETNPFRPGCSFEKLRELAQKGVIRPETVIRGPTTRQFWTLAYNTPAVAALLGGCHACHARVDPDDYMCKGCGAVLNWSGDRQHLGLTAIKLLPGQAPAKAVATSGMLSAMGGLVAKREETRANVSGSGAAKTGKSSTKTGNHIEESGVGVMPHALGVKAALIALLGIAGLAGAITSAVLMGPDDSPLGDGARHNGAAMVEPVVPRNH